MKKQGSDLAPHALYQLGRERGYRKCEREFWKDIHHDLRWHDVDYLLWAYPEDPFIQNIAYRLATTLPSPQPKQRG